MARRGTTASRTKSARLLRWARFGAGLCLLVAVGVFYYLHEIGLPDFFKRKLQSQLRAQGLHLDFQRLRLSWNGHIIAEDLSLERTALDDAPRLFIRLARIKLDRSELVKFKLHVRSLSIEEGRLLIPLTGPEKPWRRLPLEQIRSEIHFRSNDQWELDRFQADFLGTRLQISGRLDHASRLPKARFGPSTNQWDTAPLARWVEIIEQMDFVDPPRLELRIMGDAANVSQSHATLTFEVPGAQTPWGTLDQMLLTSQLLSSTESNEVMRAQFKLHVRHALTQWGDFHQAELTGQIADPLALTLPQQGNWHLQFDEVQTPWGEARNGRLTAVHTHSPSAVPPVHTDLQLTADSIQTEQGELRNGELTAQLEHNLTHWIPVRATGDLQANRIQSRWGDAHHSQFHLELAENKEPPPDRPASRSWWTEFIPYQIQLTGGLHQVTASNVTVDSLHFDSNWEAPRFQVNQLHAELYRGEVDSTGVLDMATRELDSTNVFDFDVKQIRSLLTDHAREWLSQFEWNTPPQVRGRARLVLPAWTNASPDWKADVFPTVQLDGYFEGTNGTFRGVPVSRAHSHFTLSNLVWELPDLTVIRPEGEVNLEYTGHAKTKRFHWKVRGGMDPRALKPMMKKEEHREAVDDFEFTEPPRVRGTVWGRWEHPEDLRFTGEIVATNFVYRSEAVSRVQSEFTYSNLFLNLTHVGLERARENITLQALGIDLDSATLEFTDALCHIDAQRVARTIGPKTAEAIAPYRFDQPPTVRVDGTLRVRELDRTDLRFDVSGGPFHFWKFNLPHIRGRLHWSGDSLIFSDVEGEFYQGQLDAQGRFEFAPEQHADFQFNTVMRQVDLARLMGDLSPDNDLEGTLDARLTVNSANTADWSSWNGNGRIHLRNGLIWDIPLFGIFSPLLNAVIPGLGNSRADEGLASFTIRDSVIHSDELEIRAPAMRMYYDGTVDFKGNVDARVEASLLRDAWLVGPIFSLALSPLTKIFEFRITGTLTEPQSKPVYFPKFMLFPLRPFSTLKELFGAPPPEPLPDSSSTKPEENQ